MKMIKEMKTNLIISKIWIKIFSNFTLIIKKSYNNFKNFESFTEKIKNYEKKLSLKTRNKRVFIYVHNLSTQNTDLLKASIQKFSDLKEMYPDDTIYLIFTNFFDFKKKIEDDKNFNELLSFNNNSDLFNTGVKAYKFTQNLIIDKFSRNMENLNFVLFNDDSDFFSFFDNLIKKYYQLQQNFK
jgi:hypothetical protein